MAKTMEIIRKILEHLDEAMDEDWVGMDSVTYKDLEISEARWNRIIAMMVEEELIDGFVSTPTLDDFYIEYIPQHPRITLKGLKYLEENSNLAKMYRIAKELKDWVPGM